MISGIEAARLLAILAQGALEEYDAACHEELKREAVLADKEGYVEVIWRHPHLILQIGEEKFEVTAAPKGK